MSTLFADAPVSAPAAAATTTRAPRTVKAPVAGRPSSAYLRAIDPSLGAPASGPSAYLRAIDPSLGAPASGPSAYLRAIAGGAR